MAQLRETIRDEIKAELNRILSPSFIDTVTRGQQQMEHIFDSVVQFQTDLNDLKLTVKILEGAVAKSGS